MDDPRLSRTDRPCNPNPAPVRYHAQHTIMDQRTILITGANDGIGRATASRLAERGFRLVLACRDGGAAMKTARALKESTGNEQVFGLECDLASFASIAGGAEEFLAEYPALDVLINNAGVYTDKLSHTIEGYEYQFGVNYLGHFLLTKLLLPALRCADDARVVNVSSALHSKGQIDFGNLRGERGPAGYSGTEFYAQSKLANVLFTMELARRYTGEFTANALHPGIVATNLANKDADWLTSCIWSLYKPFARPPKKGAQTSIYLAASPEVRDVTGRYFDECQCLRAPSPTSRDEALARRLWEWSEGAVAGIMANFSGGNE